EAAADTPAPAGSRVLVADDQRDVLESLSFLLRSEGWGVATVTSPRKVIDELEASDFDVVLMDLNYARDTTSGQEGLDLLRDIQNLDPTLPVVVMTAWASVELAVEAMRSGARDFVEKPWDNHRLISILETQTALGRALRRSQRLEAENRILRGEGHSELIAESAAMRPVLELIERVGPSKANVLVTGENGTGKGLVARVLHGVSERRERPLITVNIGGLSETIFESELFGHVRGAFTDAKSDRVGRFELADGGTLFMDEIANVTPSQQARLLRVLETGELERVGSSKTRRVDVRIVSATNADLAEAVREGSFRQDLLFRLNTVEIRLPPLRERREDIPLLALHFLEEHSRHYRKDLGAFEEAAMRALLRHTWPGNVRELSHVVERSVLMATTSKVQVRDLGLHQAMQGPPSFEDMTLDEAEKWLVKRALERCGGNVSDAAKDLGVSRSALYRRLEKYGL
ncbi:MAG: sigma-54 dependent transcriptional regulator, partial [Holophagales bacterium]|nr:sigma-54 dependent transcriptional regulator [Holophagales bacterium]